MVVSRKEKGDDKEKLNRRLALSIKENSGLNEIVFSANSPRRICGVSAHRIRRKKKEIELDIIFINC